MSDGVFRSKSEPAQEPVVESTSSPSVVSDVSVEVPYLDYEASQGKPYTAEYFDLGDSWGDAFAGEVNSIESYISEQIKSGEVANSVSAIKNLLKSMEKMTNLKGEERSVVKVETIAAHIEFLNKTKAIKDTYRKYA